MYSESLGAVVEQGVAGRWLAQDARIVGPVPVHRRSSTGFIVALYFD